MPKLVDLSLPLKDRQLTYPKDPPIRIEAARTLASGGCNVSNITMGSHQGTHLDAPYHFLDDGATVEQIPLDKFFGPAVLVDLAPAGALEPLAPLELAVFQQHEDAFQPGARVIYRTGWDRMFGTPEYFTDCPSLTLESAEWIASRRIALLGMDTPTPSKTAGPDCHRMLLAKGVEIVIVEGLAGLDQLPRQFLFAGFPLRLVGRDGSPIRAVAVVD